MITRMLILFFLPMALLHQVSAAPDSWVIDSQQDWEAVKKRAEGIALKGGYAEPNTAQASFSSIVKQFKKRRKLSSVVFEQSPVWDNWETIDDITPPGLGNAYVFLCVAPGDYYVFATLTPVIDYPKGLSKKEKKAYKKKMAGKQSEADRGYHVWHSKDLKDWVHGGKVTHSK